MNSTVDARQSQHLADRVSLHCTWVGTFLLCVGSIFVFVPEALADGAPRKTFHVARTELPIVIDGILNEEAWANAQVADTFLQVNPSEGAPPTERTELRVLRDDENLYVAIRMYDSEPEKLIARQMVLDGDQRGDDRINLYIDTFNDQRNGYFFQTNPAGTRRDGLIENNSTFRTDWNGIWHAHANVDAQGWTAEFAIPFKTVAYAENEEGLWGFECERILRRKGEMSRWGTYSRNRSPVMMAGIGRLSGLTNLHGTGVDVRPAGSIRQARTRNRSADNPADRDNDTLLQASGDVFYKFHPSVTAGVTLNTDFLETPPDDQRNILTRFPPFLPERRAFFLQDAGIFEFGGLDETLVPYRSRSIGRRGPTEVPVDLDVGAKITGRIDNANFGALYVHLPGQDGVDASDVAVARGQLNVLDGSAIGFLGTYGQRDDLSENGLIGADFQFFDNKLFANRVILGNAYFMQTVTNSSTANAQAFGVEVEYPNDRYSGLIRYTDIGSRFNPGLGGVLRPGTREWKGEARYRVRPGNWLRTADTKAGFEIVMNRGADLETATATFDFLTLENDVGDILSFNYVRRFEHLRRRPFPISPDVAIPLGKYTFARYGAKFEAANAYAIRPILEVIWGTYFSGELFQANAKLELRPTRHLFVSLEYEQNEGELREGDFSQRLARVRVTAAFTPEISWANVIQYDNGTDRMGLSSIFRWEVHPGNDVYVVFNYDWDELGDSLLPTYTEGAIKVAWTFRF